MTPNPEDDDDSDEYLDDDIEAALEGFLEDLEDEDGDPDDAIQAIADQLAVEEDPALDDADLGEED